MTCSSIKFGFKVLFLLQGCDPVLLSCSMRLEISRPVLPSYGMITHAGECQICSSLGMKVRIFFPNHVRDPVLLSCKPVLPSYDMITGGIL